MTHDRISRLEAAINSRKDTGNEEQLQLVDSRYDTGNEEQLQLVNDLQSKLEVANSELISEKQKAQTLAAENEKLQYRISHLLRSIKNADLKLEQVKAQEQLESLKLQDS
ncbi:hypothetical protein L195_g041179 [Trifolium pratense]|uniref:Uncharacterized protein n=1 Tax=Trifolium pratense TaxID=57577 RepID=A0A2K3M2X9_TRIPR|nr:hypothetical protein L195_g041179 [Trifolium pratense]